MSEHDSSEIWRPIEGFPGYEVSNQGRVRSNNLGNNYTGRINREPRLMKPSLNSQTGYLQVVFCLKCQKFGKRIHTLVAEAFIGPIPKGMTVNHRNGIKTDNRPENLEIMTQKENNQHSYTWLNRKRPTAKDMVRDPKTGRIVRMLPYHALLPTSPEP